MGAILSKIWSLRLPRRGDAAPLARHSDSDLTDSCESVPTCSTLSSMDMDLNGDDACDMFHSDSNLVQHTSPSPSPVHQAVPIMKLNQDLLLRLVASYCYEYLHLAIVPIENYECNTSSLSCT